MKCKACDREIDVYYRVVEVNGERVKILEDLCRGCRQYIFSASDPEDFDLLECLGYDADIGDGHDH